MKIMFLKVHFEDIPFRLPLIEDNDKFKSIGCKSSGAKLLGCNNNVWRGWIYFVDN